jgi:(2R)-ethylmalonyl-CoA mutase
VDTPVVVGGIIPESDRASLLKSGAAAIYTPKDFDIARIIGEMTDLVARRRA